MAHTESAEKAATAERQDSGSSSTSHSRDKETADRIITYVYRPPKGKGKTQRVCGILGKDKRVCISYLTRQLNFRIEQIGDDCDGEEGSPRPIWSRRREI